MTDELILNNIIYISRNKSTSDLVVNRLDIEGQTIDSKSQYQINSETYPMSNRNGANAYIVNVNMDRVYLNFIPEKTVVDSTSLKNNNRIDFEYYVESIPAQPEPFTLMDGIIFRCVSEDSLPKSKENYTYYIVSNGIARQIPNYKTLEVMLAERNETLLSVRVLSDTLCNDIQKEGAIADKSSAWIEAYKDKTNAEILEELNANAQSANELLAAASENMTQQVNMVLAQAEAAKAEAEAAAAASAAAIAEAEAVKAQAEAAKAEAEAAKAEYESKE